MKRTQWFVAVAATAMLAFGVQSDAFAQRGGGAAATTRGSVEVSRPVERRVERPLNTERDVRRQLERGDVVSLRSRVTSACLADSAADFCHGGGANAHLRRRIWNACHGDNPPASCRRIFGHNDENSHLRRRIWNACHGEDANPAFCRRIFGQDPTSPHLRRRIEAACGDGSLSLAFCRRVLTDA